MNAFDERVLRDDEPVDDSGIVLDPLGEAAPIELREQLELAELAESRHSSAIRARPSSVSGSSAASPS